MFFSRPGMQRALTDALRPTGWRNQRHQQIPPSGPAERRFDQTSPSTGRSSGPRSSSTRRLCRLRYARSAPSHAFQRSSGVHCGGEGGRQELEGLQALQAVPRTRHTGAPLLHACVNLTHDAQLANKFGRDVLPPLPKKHFWKSSTNPSLVDERKDLLEKYLQGLKKIEPIGHSDILRGWLSESNNVRLHSNAPRLCLTQVSPMRSPSPRSTGRGSYRRPVRESGVEWLPRSPARQRRRSLLRASITSCSRTTCCITSNRRECVAPTLAHSLHRSTVPRRARRDFLELTSLSPFYFPALSHPPYRPM